MFYLFAAIAIFAFNLWAITRSWQHEHGHVTRGRFAWHIFFAALLPAGFLIALMELANEKWPSAWSRFWNKDVL